MIATRFDRIARHFATRRLSRRQALATAGGIAATGLGTTLARAQEASPVASPTAAAGEKTFYLFVQSFQSGSIAPKAGENSAYTLTLEHGLGQTIYFADRPSRDVGVVPTGQFLEGLGFTPENPPNAALVLEPAPGETDVAVVELFNPVYDEAGPNLTYDVEVLANWQAALELGFSEAPTDLAALTPSFGPAHLFIDDCADKRIECYPNNRGYLGTRTLGTFGYCWNVICQPCGIRYKSEIAAQCNHTFPDLCSQGDGGGCWFTENCQFTSAWC